MNIFSVDNFLSVSHVRQHWETIRDEFLLVQQYAEKWPPKAFLGSAVDSSSGKVTNNNGYWDYLPLFINGKWLVDDKFCPITMSLITGIPNLWLAGFSILNPGCKIFPHRGPADPEVFKYHLGLIAPQGAWINVGGEQYFWKDGEDMVFDDAIEHYAENPTEETRVILMIDLVKENYGHSILAN